MRPIRSWPFVFTAATLAFACGASAQPIQVIFTKIPGTPKAAVPGAVDLTGAAATTDFRALEDFFVSPDGTRWILKGRTQLGADLENILIAGSGLTGTRLVQEGNLIPGGLADERYEFFGSAIGMFDDLNNFAFSARARTMATGSTNAPNGHRVLFWDGTTITLRFKQGDIISGLTDLAPAASGDETFGNSVGSIHPLNDGRIGSQDSTILVIHTSRRPAIMYNSAGFHQTGVTMFTDIDGSTMRTWATLTANAFFTSPDGVRWMAQGRGNDQASTATVLVRDGTAVMKTGSTIPGSTVVVDSINAFTNASRSPWYARGDDAASNDWAVRNNLVVAKTGDAITTGAAETWGAVFNAFGGNCRGDWVLMGTTSETDLGRNEVLVYNGTTVIAREGDPIDVNGNGMFDDDAFIGRGNNTLTAFEANDVFITQDRTIYFIANLRNAAGVDLNSSPVFGTPQAFMRTRVVNPCPGDFNGVGGASVQDIFDFLAAYFGGVLSADVNNNCILTVQDIFDFLAFYFTPCV